MKTPKDENSVSREFYNSQISQKDHDIHELYKTIKFLEHEKAVLQWALTGIVHSQAKVSIRTDMHNLKDLEANMPHFAENVASRLLSQAKLAFNLHSDVLAMRDHINYMESHAGARGVSFSTFKERMRDSIPNSYSWPKSEMFSPPLRDKP